MFVNTFLVFVLLFICIAILTPFLNVLFFIVNSNGPETQLGNNYQVIGSICRLWIIIFINVVKK